MYLNLCITSASQTLTISDFRPYNCRVLKLLNAYVTTSSSTNKMYYVSIPDLVYSIIQSNVSSKTLIPVYVGYNTTILPFLETSLRPSYSVQVYDSNGSLTSDTISINLLFYYE